MSFVSEVQLVLNTNPEVSLRIQRMIEAIVEHETTIDKFPQGQVILNFNGSTVKAQLDKLALTVKNGDT